MDEAQLKRRWRKIAVPLLTLAALWLGARVLWGYQRRVAYDWATEHQMSGGFVIRNQPGPLWSVLVLFSGQWPQPVIAVREKPEDGHEAFAANVARLRRVFPEAAVLDLPLETDDPAAP